MRSLSLGGFEPLGVGFLTGNDRLGARIHFLLRQAQGLAQLICGHLEAGVGLAQLCGKLHVFLLYVGQFRLLGRQFAGQRVGPDKAANCSYNGHSEDSKQRAGVGSWGFFSFTHSFYLPCIGRLLPEAVPGLLASVRCDGRPFGRDAPLNQGASLGYSRSPDLA